MIAYKGFRKDLTCTMGKGTFQYEVGKLYMEEKAKCANTGFHAATNPLDVLSYYNGNEDRYFIVELFGDIDEDGADTRISAEGIVLKKEISKLELYLVGVLWMAEKPLAKWANIVKKDLGDASGAGAVIVRGRKPKARGNLGDTLFLVMEGKDGQVEQIGSWLIDGEKFQNGKYYNVKGDEVREKRRTK